MEHQHELQSGSSSADNDQGAQASDRPSSGGNSNHTPHPQPAPEATVHPQNGQGLPMHSLNNFNPWTNGSSGAAGPGPSYAAPCSPFYPEPVVLPPSGAATPSNAARCSPSLYGSPGGAAGPGPSNAVPFSPFYGSPGPAMAPASGAPGQSNTGHINQSFGMYMPFPATQHQFAGYGQQGFPMSPMGGHFFPPQPSPYLTKAGLPFKAPPGRPKKEAGGSTRKRKKKQEEQDSDPEDSDFQSSNIVTRSKTAAQGDPPQTGQGQVVVPKPILPPRNKEDVSCPRDKKAACSRCRFWIARYVMLPCYDAAFCIVCLAKEHFAAEAEKRLPKCYGCGGEVSEYMQSFRCSILDYNPVNEDDED